jgi:hypothetical protein
MEKPVRLYQLRESIFVSLIFFGWIFVHVYLEALYAFLIKFSYKKKKIGWIFIKKTKKQK